jgi:hypothetical protein
MARQLYSRTDHDDRGPGLMVLTQAANGGGKGTRLELYAATHDDDPVEVQEPYEALELARLLLTWATEELERRKALADLEAQLGGR